MSRILLQTTIEQTDDDWNVARFSLLAQELRAAGHEVTARDRDAGPGDDQVLSVLGSGEYDQLWLLAVDAGDGLTPADAAGIMRFRENGGGVLTARDHEDLGSCLLSLGVLGQVNYFHRRQPPPDCEADDQDNPNLSWPNYHSGANGDYQPVFAVQPIHELLRTEKAPSGQIEWFPAHPHEGAVAAAGIPFARVLAEGRSAVTGRRFNLAVPIDGERTTDGRSMGRAIAESSFHHFADLNWDTGCGAPSFVTDRPGTEMKGDPSRLEIFKDYVRNLASWLASG